MKTLKIFVLIIIVFTFLACNEDDDSITSNDTKEVTLEEVDVNPEYIVVDTGQETCYDSDGGVITAPLVGESFYGQDAQFTGTQFSLQADDGIVTDLNSGLMWQQVPSSKDYTWQEAVDYCESLELGGYTEWRIPSLKELYSISTFNSGWP